MLQESLEPPMASTTPAADTAAEETAAEQRDDLEFRARHQLTIDPAAHTLLPIAEAKQLGAVPLGKEGGRTVIAVADPAESRLAALRELAGAKTKFVLIAPDALNALLKSRIFTDGAAPPPVQAAPAKVAPPPEVELPPPPPIPVLEPIEVAEVVAVAAQAEPVEAVEVASAVAVATAVETVETFEAPAAPPRYEPQPLPPPRRAQAPSRKGRKPEPDGELADLAAAVAGAADLLTSLQDRITDFAAQLEDARKEVEEARQEAREHKERLAALSAKADQDRARVKTFATGLTKAFARLEETKEQLLDLVDEE